MGAAALQKVLIQKQDLDDQPSRTASRTERFARTAKILGMSDGTNRPSKDDGYTWFVLQLINNPDKMHSGHKLKRSCNIMDEQPTGPALCCSR
jgi:hypothetical protein